MLLKNSAGSVISTSASVFNNVRCVDSIIKDNCCIGDDCDIQNTHMECKSELGRRNLIRDSLIGKGSYTGTNTIIKNAKIGRYCSISWNVSIGGLNHNYSRVSMYSDYWFKRTFSSENRRIVFHDLKADDNVIPVEIGNDVWIASGAIILSGVKIGDGCVIGAGSIVTHDIEPYSIVVGVPGKIIKKRFDDDIIEKLELLKWWNWPEDLIIQNIDFLRNEPSVEMIEKYLKDKNND